MHLLDISQKRFNQLARRLFGRAKRYTEADQTRQFLTKISKLKSKQIAAIALRPNPLRRKSCEGGGSPSPIALVLVVVSLTSAIGHRLYNEPQLDVNTIAPQTIRAPESASVVDTETTETQRQAARTGAVPVLMVDQAVNQEIYQTLQRLFVRGDELRQQAGPLPYVETSVLSTATQRYLRQAQEWEWRVVLASLNADSQGTTAPRPQSSTPESQAAGVRAGSSQQLAIIELQAYQQNASEEDFSALREVISRARQRYAVAAEELESTLKDEQSKFYDPSFFNLTDLEWSDAKNGIRQALERILLQGVPPGLPDSVLENAVRAQLDLAVPSASKPLASKILMNAVRSNLVQDPEQTRLLADQAAEAVEPEIVEIRRGEVITQAGEPISQSDFVLLDHFGLSRRGINWLGVIGFGGLVTGGVAIFLLVERRFHPGLRRRDHLLVFLLTLTTPLLIALGVPATNLPALGLLIGSFYGSALGITVIGLLSIALPIGMEISWVTLTACAIGSLFGAGMAGRLRSREELALLGGAVGLAQGVIYLLLSLILTTPANPVWYAVLTQAVLQGLMGLAWSIVALGISPYLEQLFDLVTPIRLAELSNPNRPLLKKLASDAPGTFQHTLFVATLAEAAARALGCNVELVRAGTLYHDIGKMHDALGFIENQMGGPNKHDLIDDPQKSAAIIKKHVSEGLVMARKYRLPKAIQAFIPEHQGSMLITYFYYQAQQRSQENPGLIINEAEFRYDGPIPQSRETGIVMLADSCEAALRSLKDASRDEALAMVNRILRARWQDNQMVDSGLTRADMSKIAEIFVRVWQQFNHHRIPYPKAAFGSQPAPAGK
ncbi:MAG: HDIG domain-containing protein [Leptolyngbyaceae cyanobacterium SM1_4_3]|nr:HDIG domain-containing protein [Leptolyngbyaceae cyanobacterium SM1_4_3]NJN91052.1 HDIG domain-containing protein [Leptolyngbyaceae cyanobacterium SL_5_14]